MFTYCAHRCHIVLMLAMLGFAAGGARAATVEVPGSLTQVASACTPDESASPRYAFSGADFHYRSGHLSAPLPDGKWRPIIARCNVVNTQSDGNVPRWNRLVVGYVDPDGLGKAHRVVAALRSVDRTDGTLRTVVVFDSNDLARKERGEAAVALDAPLNFGRFEYFIELSVYRLNHDGNPAVFMTRLAEFQPIIP